MAISRLFFEISGDSSKLKTALDEAVEHAKQAGVNVTAAGRRFIDAFDNALSPTKKLTEQITLLEKAGKSQADIMKVMETQIASATKAAKDMGQPIDALVQKYTSLETRMKQAGESMMSFGRNMSMYVSAPIIAIGGAAMKAADDYDKAVAKIRIGTGATGEKLKSLTTDMMSVWGSIPDGAEKVGSALADLNTRLGLTGKPLQEMTTKMLNLARMSGSEVGPMIAAATRTFGDWSIATASQSHALDYLFKTSQQTGIKVQQLMEIVVQFGAPMRALGFSFEQAVAMMGKWEKEGVNMETVLSGLRFALGNFAKAGADPVVTLQALIDKIKNAKTESEATALSFQVFGKRAAVDMGRAIIEGRLNIEDLVESLKNSTDTINAAEEESKTFGERMDELRQKTEKALVPVGEKLLEAFIKLEPFLIKAIDKIAGLAQSFADLDPWAQKAIIGFAGFVAAIGPAAFTIGSVAKAIGSLSGLIGGGAGLTSIMGGLGKASLVAGAAIAGWEIGRWIAELFDLDNKLANVWKSIGLFQGAVKEGATDLENASMKLYAGLVEKHSEKLKEMNIDITRGNSSLDEWNTRLLKAAVSVGAVKDPTVQLHTAIEQTGKKATIAGGALDFLDNDLKKLREDLDKASRPADVLAAEMDKLRAAHAPMNQIMAAYAEQLVKAADRQTELGQKMKPGTEAILKQAAAFKATLTLKKEMEEASTIQSSVDDIAVKYKREELELEKKILSIRTPAGAAEKERIESEKAQIDYAIKAEDIQAQFAKARRGIYEKIDKLKPGNEALAAIMKSIAQLNEAEQQAMANLSSNKKLGDDARALEALKEQEKELKKVADIQSSIDDLNIKNQNEELELQKELLDAQIPRNAADRERIAMEKDHIDYMIRSEEIRNQYLNKRLDIYAKIKDLDPAGEAYKNAQKALNDLDEAERQAMDNLANRQGVEVIKRHQDQYQKMVEGIRDGAGEIFDTILSGGKDAFSSLRDWIQDTFVNSLRTIFQNLMATLLTGGKASFASIFAGVIPGVGGTGGQGGSQIPGLGLIGNLLGGNGSGDSGGLADLQKIMGGGEVFSAPSKGIFGVGGKAGGMLQGALFAGGSMALMDSFTQSGVRGWAEGVGGGAAMGAALGSVIPGLGTALGAAIGAAVGGLIQGVKSLISWAKGKTNQEAGVDEISRDYGGVTMGQDQYSELTKSFGFDPNGGALWKARGSVAASPQMLAAEYDLAKQQGKMDEFMGRMNNWLTYTGPRGDASKALQIGELTGDWEKLNELWKQSQYYQDLVNRGLKDQADAMIMGGEAANKLLDVFVNFRKTVKDSITDPMAEAMNTFMETGKITDGLAKAITKFGGDLAQFQQTSNLVQINKYFGEMVDHFKQTGQLLPDLIKLAGEYGANMDVLADASDRMTQLQKTAGTISTLQGSLQSMAAEFDPLQQLMAGKWNSNIEEKLAGAGLDPTKFSELAGAISGRNKWDSISQNALQGGIINKDMQDALRQFGGDEGQLALEMYQQGFNTLTQDLLDKTKAEMDRTYEEKIQDALSYLGTVGDDTNDQITELTKTVEDQLTIASDNLEVAINTAKEDLIDVLDNILIAVSNADDATIAEATAVPRLAAGGLIQKTGLAIVDKGERFDGGKGFGAGTELTINGGIFLDWAGFVNYVRMAGIELRARSLA